MVSEMNEGQNCAYSFLTTTAKNFQTHRKIMIHFTCRFLLVNFFGEKLLFRGGSRILRKGG